MKRPVVEVLARGAGTWTIGAKSLACFKGRYAESRCRGGNRAADSAVSSPAGSRSALGPPRGAVPHQNTRTGDGSARNRDPNRYRTHRHPPTLRQTLKSEPL